MEKVLVLKTREEILTMTDPYRVDIIQVFRKANLKSLTVKEIADALSEPHGKVYYHVKKLEKVGALVLDKTKKINGITAKYYKLNFEKLSINSGNDENQKELKTNHSITMVSKYFDDHKNAFVDSIIRDSESNGEGLKAGEGESSLTSMNVFFDKNGFDEFNKELQILAEKYSKGEESETIYKKTFFYSVFSEYNETKKSDE